MNNSHLQVGSVIECIHNDKILLAVITDIHTHTYHLYTITKRELKINQNRILPWSGPLSPHLSSKSDNLIFLEERLEKREQIKKTINIHELWECIAGEIVKVSVEELATLLTSQVNPDYIAALGRLLLENKDYFKFTNPFFEVYTREYYQEKKELAYKKEQKQREQEHIRKFIQLCYESVQKEQHFSITSTDIEEPYITRTKELIYNKIHNTLDQESETLWKEVTSHLTTQEVNLPILLGETLSIIPKHYNILAYNIGYELKGWEEPYCNEIERLSSVSYTYPTLELPFLSIDKETTKDIDDALYVEAYDSHSYIVHFAIALPVQHWDYKSELHKEILSRATSLYLPEQTYNMLPNRLAEEIYSLVSGNMKNILHIKVHVSISGDILDVQTAVATSKNISNTTYKDSELILESTTPSWLHEAYNLAVILQEKRLNNGGIIIQRAEQNIELQKKQDDYIVHIHTLEEEAPKSQLLVSELMILANTAIVQFAKKHDIPLIHRVQECSTPTGSQRIWKEPEAIHSVIKMLTSVTLDIQAKRHSALGILGYATITSPLRRIVDFINEEQIYSFLTHGIPHYSEDALCSLIPQIQRYTEQSLSIQRNRLRYWKLYFLQQRPQEWFTGIFVDETMYIHIYIPIVQLTVRVKKSICGNKCIIGERVEVRCYANALQNDLNIIEVR